MSRGKDLFVQLCRKAEVEWEIFFHKRKNYDLLLVILNSAILQMKMFGQGPNEKCVRIKKFPS